MTGMQADFLSVADDGKFSWLCKEYGFEHAGPSAGGSFLIRSTDHRAWLFSAVHQGSGGTLPSRTIVASAWTETNLAVMRNQPAESWRCPDCACKNDELHKTWCFCYTADPEPRPASPAWD